MAYKILVLKGDGIGPEVVGEALQVLKVVARNSALDLEFKEAPIGGHALDQFGTPLTDEVLKQARDCDAILLGAVGGPKWDNPKAEKRPEQALLTVPFLQTLGFAKVELVSVFEDVPGGRTPTSEYNEYLQKSEATADAYPGGAVQPAAGQGHHDIRRQPVPFDLPGDHCG